MGVRTAEQQGGIEAAADQLQPLEAVLQGSLVEEQLGPAADGPIATKRPQLHVEYVFGHGGACAARSAGRQAAI
jgi:hypothetical protein